MWDRRAEFLYNFDGDSIRMILDQGFYDTKEVEIRLLGVFAPELREPGGEECKQFVKSWFSQNYINKRWSYIVTTARMKNTDAEQRTFTRYVGTVTSLDGNRSLNQELIEFIQENGYGGGIGS